MKWLPEFLLYLFMYVFLFTPSYNKQSLFVLPFYFFNWWDDPLNYSCKVVLFSCFSNKLIEPHPYSGIMIFTDWVSLSRSNPHLIAHVWVPSWPSALSESIIFLCLFLPYKGSVDSKWFVRVVLLLSTKELKNEV